MCKKPGNEEESIDNPEKKYGWLGMYIKSLQCINKPVFFLVCLCCLVVAQGMIITGITSIIITSIQTRFGFNSIQAGALSSSYDTAYGISTIFVSFFGHTRKPKLLGLGSFVLAVGCFTATIPNYLVGKYHAGVVTDIDWCNVNKSGPFYASIGCKNASWYYLAIFCLAYVTMGIGATPLYTLGPSHLDESTKRGQNGLYIGIMYAFASFGPAIGFLIGKPILSTYVDIKQPPGSNLTPEDSIWVGAWWLGYLVGCVLFLAVCLPMLGFPQEFQSTESIRQAKKELEDTVEEDPDLQTNFKSLIPATKALLTNKCFVFISLAVTLEGLATGGFSTFLPKFFESQYFVTSSNAALYSGAIVVPGAGGGIFLGGYLLKKYKWNCRKTIKMSMIFSFLAFSATAAALIGCETKKIAGVNVAYHGKSAIDGIDSSCRLNCTCSFTYKPICTKSNGIMYYSACHAGCERINTNGNKYNNCTCFPPGITMADKGGCNSVCNLMFIFMPLFLLTMVFTFLNNVPLINATFRVVPESQASYALGFQQVFVRFLGFIPGPILFGKFVDKACILWQRDPCDGGSDKNCLEYNNSSFRYYLYAISGISKFLSFVFLVLAYYSYTPPIQNNVRAKLSQQDLVLHDFCDDDSTMEVKNKQPSMATNGATTKI